MSQRVPAILAHCGIFVFFAAMFAVPSGYSYGGGLLLLGGLYAYAARTLDPKDWNASDRLMIWVLLAYFLVPSLMTLVLNNNVTDIDQYSRALLSIPILLLLLARRVRLEFMWAAIVLGIVLSAPLAWWQVTIQHKQQADGFLNAIHFSNIALVFTALCLGGLYWAGGQIRHVARWRFVFGLGIICGLYSMIVGGSRGSWVALPPVLVVFLCAFLTRQNIKRIALATVAGLIILAGIFALPDSPLQRRYDQAIYDITQYQHNKTNTSIGARFEMWRGARTNLKEKPLVGWNEDDYTHALEQQVARGTLTPVALKFDNNLHNNFVQAWVFTGLPGLLALLALYTVPFWHFVRRIRAEDMTERVLAFCGTSLVVSYVCFSMSQVILRRNNGIMFYLLALVILWGAMHHAEKSGNSPSPSI